MEHRIDASKLNSQEMESVLSLVRKAKKTILIDAEGNRVKLPAPLNRFLTHVLEQVKKGHSVIMIPEEEALTTQAAANYLGVSRQHLVDLLERGTIPFHKTGTHRRIYYKDLAEYSQKRDVKRRKTLDSLFDSVTKAGKYDSSFIGDET